MKTMILLTTSNGNPILVNGNGLTIEPEIDTGRCIVTLPHLQRHGKAILTVQQDFTDICAALNRSGHLVEVTAEPPAPPFIAEVAPWADAELEPGPLPVPVITSADAEIAVAVHQAQKRGKKSKSAPLS